jgi:hypothetical protein
MRSLGIWDCQSSQAVVEFVRRGIAAKQELHLICENMMDNCLASNSETGGVGCDNMTMIVIGLLNGKSKKEWYDLIGKRVANGDGPCAPPEYGKFSLLFRETKYFLTNSLQPSFGVPESDTNSIMIALMNMNLTWTSDQGASGVEAVGSFFLATEQKS